MDELTGALGALFFSLLHQRTPLWRTDSEHNYRQLLPGLTFISLIALISAMYVEQMKDSGLIALQSGLVQFHVSKDHYNAATRLYAAPC